MFARHSLVWLTDAGWLQAERDVEAPDRDAIQRWHRHDWPAVARRGEVAGEVGHAATHALLGVALPPHSEDGMKRRIPLRIACAEVKRTARPLRLESVIPHAPVHWRQKLIALDHAAQQLGICFLSYGSLAWQALTGQRYLSATSDIDLLFFPANLAQLRQGVALLGNSSPDLPLDGEIVFKGGQAVAWKEWRSCMDSPHPAHVLVKEIHGIRLCSAAALLATLESSPCMT